MRLPEFFGLDLGYSSVKMALVSGNDSDKKVIEALGQGDIEKAVTLAKDEIEKKALAERLRAIKDAAGIKTNKVVVALPEAAIFSKIIAVPDLPEDQLEKVIFFEARNHLPIPPEDVQLDYIPIAKKNLDNDKRIQQILLIAAPKVLVNNYLEVLGLAGFEVLALETESLASARVLSATNDTAQGILSVDFGAQGIAVAVIKNGSVIFSQSIGTGSDALTQAIARDYNLDPKQAEQYKRTYGLLTDQLEGRIAKSITPVMQIISNELYKIINFIKINLADYAPQQIFISGEGSLLPGLVTYLNLNLGMPVKQFDPVAGFQLQEATKVELAKYSAPGFSVALGLALKTE